VSGDARLVQAKVRVQVQDDQIRSLKEQLTELLHQAEVLGVGVSAN